MSLHFLRPGVRSVFDRRLILLLHFTLGFAVNGLAADSVDYLQDVKPILAEKCYSCHGTLRQESGLRLETLSLIRTGGDSGEALVPGNPKASLLLERITASNDERMPPAEDGAALKPFEVELIRRWIQQGAEAPDEPTPASPSDHWAFRKIDRPEIPDSPFANPIDALLSAKRSRQGVKEQPQASRTLLIRRLYLDLIGIPPTREQLADQREWETIVDELLESPHHGERWARHWMDVWRYSDWYGLGAQLRNSQKHLWHWRDWIIQSLNDDKGYDRMVLEMLAGDELAPADPDAIAGTGFLARNYYLFNRTTWLDSTIEHTGKAFLGLTLNCAKCHDHKYDPVSQRDYYRMRAVFEPHQVRLDPVPGETDFEKDGLPRVFDDHVDAETYLHRRGNPKDPDKSEPISPGVPEFLAGFAPAIQPVSLPTESYAPSSRSYVQQDRLRSADKLIEQSEAAVRAAEIKLNEAPNEPPGPREVTPFQLEDDFEKPNDQLWELVGDGWQYRNGQLHQTVATRERYAVKCRKQVPEDFELTCTYTTTGGATYKSVTFRFDQSDDGKFCNFVYTSAHAPGPKVHVAYTRNGKDSYPSEGRKNRKIEIGQTYTIRFAVRGTLVNVWLDDEFMVAYRLPNRKADGFLSLSAFDATVAYDSIRIGNLPADSELIDAKNRPEQNRSTAKHALALARAKLESARAERNSLQARFDADIANHSDAEKDHVIVLSKAAARAQLMASKHADIVETLSAVDDAKIKAAKKRIEEADKQLSVDAFSANYKPIRASRKALETPAHKEADYPAVYSSVSTGRRLALAKWVVARQNPLTARVAVNQVWMRHFGRPLVESVFDFGLRAKKPLHHDVLDMLAYEWMESGWSFRHLHRLIVTSEAYRLSSSTLDADPNTVRVDPQNNYLWRMNARRMESQIVRDSLLSIAGELSPQIGGPSIDPKAASNRRSIYFLHSRDQQDRFLSMFDDADHLQCYRRSESVVPQQALALSNSKLAIESAEKIAARLRSQMQVDDWSAFVTITFETLIARAPTEGERRECDAYRTEMLQLLSESKDAETRLRTRFVHAMINHNDFIAIR